MRSARITLAGCVARRADLRCARRHFRFVERLHRARRKERRTAPVPLVLLRPMRPLLARGATLINFALNVIARGSLRAVPQAYFTQPAGHTSIVTQTRSSRLLTERMVVHRTCQLGVLDRRQVKRESAGSVFRSEGSVTQILRSSRFEQHNAYPRLTVALARAPARAAPAAVQSVTPQADAVQTLFGVHVPASQPALRDVLRPQELSRVTDHVLAELDRKVLSYRERLGQI